MEIININILENLLEENISKNINQIFINLLKEIQKRLKLKVVNSNVKVIYKKTKNDIDIQKQNILDLGVKKIFRNGVLNVEIFEDYEKYLPFILLREAYYCFIPKSLKENKAIKIIINQIVEINLHKFEEINEWKSLIRKYVVDYDFLAAEFDRLEKFLKLQGLETITSPVKLFFEYVRKNALLIDSESIDLHDNILKEFVLKTSKSINSDEMVETLRVLIIIFYRAKSYKALLNYQNSFKKFIKDKQIITELSLRKFSDNLRWINRFSYIAPSYSINWKKINAGVLFCNLTFNPLLKKAHIDQIIEELPFFWSSKSSESYFAVEISGWFIFPLIYQDDLCNFLNKLERFGYIIKKTCFLRYTSENSLNLNYFREFYRGGRIINPKHRDYDKKYEIEFKIDHEYDDDDDVFKLSILDYVILNRAMFWSMDGFSFERRKETVKTIKSDLFNEILSQGRLIKKLKKNISIFHDNQELKRDIVQILRKNQNFGFFYIKNFFQNLLVCLKVTKKLLSNNLNIRNTYQFQEFVKKWGISQSINKNILFNNNDIKKNIFQNFLPIYFQNKKKFKVEEKKYRTITKFLNYCHRLKIFDLKAIEKLIEDKDIVNKIYAIKEQKLKKIHQNYKLQNITSGTIDDVLDILSSEKSLVIKPLLINTINTTSFAKYFIQIILKYNLKIKKSINKIKKYFPRVYCEFGVDLFNKEKLCIVHIYLANINEHEKGLFVSFLNNLFGENILTLKRYFFDGFYKSHTLKDFYDLDKQEFFYTKDLFEQYFKYVQKIFGKLRSFEESKVKNQNIFWSPVKDMKNLINQIDKRIYREMNEFNVNNLHNLSKFNLNLEEILEKPEKFKEIKRKDFFRNYIKSIKFKPIFQNFNLGQYYLYICSTNISKIDFKLLFVNNFQSVKYPAYIDNRSLFIKYLFPYRNPNVAYVNWLTKSKKIVSEYCVFFVKKLYVLLDFDRNISSKGWDLDPRLFRSYIQKVLFDPSFNEHILKIKECDIGGINLSYYYDPRSPQFKSLTGIYGWKPTDIKSILGTKNYSLIKEIKDLIKSNIIFPYLKLKNLDFQEKIYIILPFLKKELIEIIVKIFNFFNYGFIYVIEGEYFIQGFNREKKFENGLLIKLYLPLTEISDFQRVFNLLFQFLKIKKYLILNDLIDGKNLIKNTFGNLKFLDSYNPLKNLKWNDKDKIWMNHKLFGENFEPNYPELM